MKLRLAGKRVPITATAVVCVLLYAAACVRYPGFFSWEVFVNFLRDNAFLGLAAIGMTFVILSGGIDLSVGAMIGLTSMIVASAAAKGGVNPLIVIPAVLALGAAFGAAQGCVIAFFELPPFLVTLAGMFLARGLAFVIGLEAVQISSPVYDAVDDFSYNVFPATALTFLLAVPAALYLAHFTRFGRAVYAIGGNEQSAALMGLPVRGAKVRVYALSGLCSSLAGVVFTFYTSSGNPNAGTTLELDAIAAVVIGGTLLSGGVGYVFGTLIGVLMLGMIQTIITFEGTLSSWWTKIFIGALLLVFILLQKLVQTRAAGGGRAVR